jgi:hypothetical protein
MASEFALDAILLQALQNPKDRAFILGSEKTCESLFHPNVQYDKSAFLMTPMLCAIGFERLNSRQ